MQAVWLRHNRIEFRSDFPKPSPLSGDALVRVHLTGICSTDLQLLTGYYSFTGIPGHEFVGQVEQAPEAPNLVGHRVVGRINIPCGRCVACRKGWGNHCRKRKVLGLIDHHGAFAEYLLLPVDNLLVVPDNLSDEMAVFAEPLAAAIRIQEQVRLFPGQRILVIGAGRLGQLVARTLASCGDDLMVSARYARQRELLEIEGIKWLEEHRIARDGFDLVIEATGCAQGFQQAAQAVRPGGTVVLKSTFQKTERFNPSSLVADEVTLVGSRCGPMDKALDQLTQGTIDPRPLIDAIFPLHHVCEAFEKAAAPGSMKILLSAI